MAISPFTSLAAAGRRLLTGWDRVDFAPARQERVNWCWAACSSGVSGYYDGTTSWTQCAVAQEVLQRQSCCDDAHDPACDVVESLTTALACTNNLAGVDETAAAYAEVRHELRLGRPVAARIQWGAGPRAHFIVVTGCRTRGEERLLIQDPSDGSTRDVPFALALTSYQHDGQWKHTYRTRAT